MSQSECLRVKETGRSGCLAQHSNMWWKLINLWFSSPLPPACLPTGRAPWFYAALHQSDRLFTALVTMEPAEGLTMSPWKLHLFTTELSVKEDEASRIDSCGEITIRTVSISNILCFHVISQMLMLTYLQITSAFYWFSMSIHDEALLFKSWTDDKHSRGLYTTND